MTTLLDQPWPSGETPVLDETALAVLRGLQEPGQPDFLLEITTEFLADTSRRILELEAAVARFDATMVHRVAHAIKGGAWTIGAMRLGQACAALEKDAATGRLADARVWSGRIAVEYQLVSTAVRSAC